MSLARMTEREIIIEQRRCLAFLWRMLGARHQLRRGL